MTYEHINNMTTLESIGKRQCELVKSNVEILDWAMKTIFSKKKVTLPNIQIFYYVPYTIVLKVLLTNLIYLLPILINLKKHLLQKFQILFQSLLTLQSNLLKTEKKTRKSESLLLDCLACICCNHHMSSMKNLC